MITAGYSGKPLLQKLGLKAGKSAAFLQTPAHYAELLGPLPHAVAIHTDLDGLIDFIHYFTTSRTELQVQFPHLKAALTEDGMLWISWPKGRSKIQTDLNENIIREIGLTAGLVDVKVCAVDNDYSGLKFVYRLRDRKR